MQSSWAESDVVIDYVVVALLVKALEGAAHVIIWVCVNSWASFFHPLEAWHNILSPNWVFSNTFSG